jgi:MerR family transcriptional regulator, light-induced transcriptional regulator
MNLYEPGVSIGELAKRTGAGISTLRAWERRHGFPVPQRLPSGHRRYSERDVDAVIDVLRDREAGSTLEAALARAKRRTVAPTTSVFAAIQHAVPEISPAVLSKRSMLAISRAIEDEAAGRARDAMFFGAFQAERFWRATRARWRDVATRSGIAVALGTFEQTRRHGNLFEVAIAPSSPMAREWAVVCDAASFAAALVGVERPGQDNTVDDERVFEALWTVEPAPVRSAARAAAEITRAATSTLDAMLPARLVEPPAATFDIIRSATTLTNRIVSYLESQNRR